MIDEPQPGAGDEDRRGRIPPISDEDEEGRGPRPIARIVTPEERQAIRARILEELGDYEPGDDY